MPTPEGHDNGKDPNATNIADNLAHSGPAGTALDLHGEPHHFVRMPYGLMSLSGRVPRAVWDAIKDRFYWVDGDHYAADFDEFQLEGLRF